MNRFLLDVVERTVATYATTFLGLLLASGFDLTSLGALKAAAIAAIPAALTVIKGVLAGFVGDPTSAAMLPAAASSPSTTQTL
jgi:hypothetical protein